MTNLTMSQFDRVALHSGSDLQASALIFQRIASRYRGKVRGNRRLYFKLRKDLWFGILPSQHRRDDLWKSRRCHMYLWTIKAMFDGQESEQKLISMDIEASNAYEDGGSSISGPLPGDLAEVEAFCRIFRFAEQLHNVVFDALRSVSDSRNAEPSENEGDIPLLEEKVVSGLACIGALLHNKKQQVLGGRGGGSEFAEKSDTEAGSTRLADFRSKMLKCGEQLEMALCCYFPPVDDWGIAILRRFQKFRNVCYDSGIPRPEGSPSHADIPNWVEVTLWPVRGGRIVENNEAMFWRGGSITEDGLCWLLDKKFKTIVDLRVEEEIDQLAKAALENAVSKGRLKLVNMPVQPGMLPTKQQVEEFTRLVADLKNRPLYLSSHEGVGRTSAMITRWREIALRWASSPFTMDDIANGKDSDGIDSVAVEADYGIVGMAGGESDYISVDDQDALESISHLKLAIEEESEMVLLTDSMNSEGASVVDDSEDEGKPLGDGVYPNSPFDAQRPAVNVLSRRAMSKFKKGRTVTPSRFLYQAKSFKKVTSFRDARVANGSIEGESIAGPAGWWALASPGIPRALTGEVAETPAENQEGNNSNGALVRVKTEEVHSDDNEEPAVVGDMCVSTTGVVRLQSRKKAEIYLVRTDGASCARERVKESTLAFTHPSTQQQMLMWKTPPKTVFLLKKLGSELMEEAQQVASFLYYHEGMNVLVEPDVHDRFARFPGFGFVQTFHNQDTSDLHERVDFVVCLGGDGVILHASNIFRNAIPPVVAFNLGSLGFLTTHPFEDFKQDLQDLIHGNNNVGVYITLRMRLRCELFRNGKPIPGKVFDVLNEVVVDRGSNPYLCKIECYERNRLITKVQADGVIVATPTGSTAYSTSAGGSMVHPNVPCMLFTPICPHSLSFRPVILPDSALLELKVPRDARSNAWVSFDGKRRQQLSKGDSVRVSMSEHPLPTVNKSDQTDDWFRSLVRCLNWNERLEQKTLSFYS